MQKIKPFNVIDRFAVEIKCDRHATKPDLLHIHLESKESYEAIELTQDQARKLRDWLEHEYLDKV